MRGVEGECFDAVSAYAATAREEAEKLAEENAEEGNAEPEAPGTPGTDSGSSSTTVRDGDINDPG
jgi:hypothetical protein